jgi:glycosyltransferase involved in cell wall biosynthesis
VVDKDAPALSLVLPVFNGANFIAASIRSVCGALEQLDGDFELVVVCDGSTDGTAECARGVGDRRVRVLHYGLNAGKGHAIAHGISVARGRIIGWLDSDLDIAPEVIVDFVRRMELGEEVDAVVGSKRHPQSRVRYPPIRRLYSFVFQLLVCVLFRIRVRDSQVGAKVFRREVLDTVAPLLVVKRYAFDLEVLAVGAEFGFDRVEEAPISLAYRFTGTGINWRAVGRMLVDTLAIAYRIHVRHWYVRRFAALHRQRLDDAMHAPLPPPGAPLAAATAWPPPTDTKDPNTPPPVEVG